MKRTALVALAGLAWACGDNSGALSQASFGTGCSAGSTCVSGINAPLAVGAVLPLVVEINIAGTTAPPMRLEGIGSEIFRTEGFAAIGVNPGLSALYVVGPEETVVDFIHLWVEKADRLEGVRRSWEGAVLGKLGPSITLLAGDEVLFSLEPIAGSQQLLGDFAVDWEGGGDVVRVLPAGVDDWQRLVARGPGKVTLTGTALGLTKSFEVEVLP